MQFYCSPPCGEEPAGGGVPLTRVDVIFGCLVTDIVALSIIVACGATCTRRGSTSRTRRTRRWRWPAGGKYASTLFAIGLANASLFAASILPLPPPTASAKDGWSRDRQDFRTAPQFFWLYTGLIVSGGAGPPPARPAAADHVPVPVINGVLLPFVLIFMLKLINDGS